MRQVMPGPGVLVVGGLPGVGQAFGAVGVHQVVAGR